MGSERRLNLVGVRERTAAARDAALRDLVNVAATKVSTFALNGARLGCARRDGRVAGGTALNLALALDGLRF